MKKFVTVILVLVVITVVAITWFSRNTTQDPPKELNLLCWVGYDEPDFIEPFEKEFHVKVKAKTYVGGDQMFAMFTQSPQTYDVVVVDPEYIKKLHVAGRLAELNPNDFHFDDYFSALQDFPLSKIDGHLYAVLIRWGANGLVYNTNHLNADDVKSYSILWDPKVKGRVGIWDWYLPSMGTMSCSLGNKSPFDIDNENFTVLRSRLFDLRRNIAAIHPTPPELFSALANEQTWIVPAGGESFAAVLKQQGKSIDWTIPKEGGLMWGETLVIAKDAPHDKELAKQFIQWMQRPSTQASLTHRQAYSSQAPNKKAYELLTATQRDVLKIHNEVEADAILKKLSIRQLPVQQSEKQWQEAWQDFKSR